MALSKSIIKLDLIGNLEFWTTYFFILYNFHVEDQNTIQYVSYWVIYSVLLVSIVISAMIGFVAIRKITKTYYILFFILRILAEAFKIYLIVQLWLGNTILMKKIVQLQQFSELLKKYIILNGTVTTILFLVCIQRMWLCYKTRTKTIQ